jgi:hypothetical protein
MQNKVLQSSMSFALYDSAGNVAQTSSAFDIVFEPNLIQSSVIDFTPTVFATDSKVTLNFTTNVAYAVGTYFKVSKSSSFVCQVSLTGASPSCSNSAGEPLVTQM